MSHENNLPGPCPAGYLPSWIYDQQEWWIDEDGQRLPLDSLNLPELLRALNLIERRAQADWEYEIEVFLAFVRQQRSMGIKPELRELRRTLLLGAKGWLQEKKLMLALTGRANGFIAAS